MDRLPHATTTQRTRGGLFAIQHVLTSGGVVTIHEGLHPALDHTVALLAAIADSATDYDSLAHVLAVHLRSSCRRITSSKSAEQTLHSSVLSI